jgi:hypothetical protein
LCGCSDEDADGLDQTYRIEKLEMGMMSTIMAKVMFLSPLIGRGGL